MPDSVICGRVLRRKPNSRACSQTEYTEVRGLTGGDRPPFVVIVVDFSLGAILGETVD